MNSHTPPAEQIAPPTIVAMTAQVRCGGCGEVAEFDEIENGWQHIQPCEDCGLGVSIQIGDPIVQYAALSTGPEATDG